MAGNEANDGASGHGSRTRSNGHVRADRNSRAPFFFFFFFLRARLTTPESKTTEWKSNALRADHRRGLAADALARADIRWHILEPASGSVRSNAQMLQFCAKLLGHVWTQQIVVRTAFV